jgi:hypothetical protein
VHFPIKRTRYVNPNLLKAKELADKCGQEYYYAIWRRPKLMAQRFITESAAKFTGYDCRQDLCDLDVEIELAVKNLPVAKKNLYEAQRLLAVLKNSESN